MFNFDDVQVGETKYWYIYCKYDDAVVHLPFKRDFEKQTYHLCPMTKKYLDCSSYWIEDVAYKLMCKFIRDNNLSFDDFEVREYTEDDLDSGDI